MKLKRPALSRDHQSVPAENVGPGWEVIAAPTEPGRRDATADVELQPHDIAELVWSDGMISWAIPTLDGRGDSYEVPTTRPDRAAHQGASQVLLTSWQVLRCNAGEGQQQALFRLVQEADAHLSGLHPHLVQLREDGTVDEELASPPASDQPWLLLVHGTFANVSLAFGGFSAADGREDWRALHREYRGQIYGFAHPTLSVSPLQNALDCLRLLPVDQKVDILSHSRGGLVAELIALASTENPPQIEGDTLLQALLSEGRKRRIQVGRHVRVAAPVRGTRLASPRASDVLNSLSNIVSLMHLSGQFGPVISGVSSLLSAARVIVRLLTEQVVLNPKVAPGLAAMEPGGTLVRLLNTAAAPEPVRLIVGGVFSGTEGIGGKLLRAAPEAFFRGASDLVVDTEYMYTEADRERAQYLEPTGAGIHHLAYFSQAASRRSILGWLLAKPARFPLAQRPLLAQNDRSAALSMLCLPACSPTGDHPEVVFVVPGIMGSMLQVDGKRVWIHLPSLVAGGFGNLDYTNGREVVPEGVSKGTYHPLVDALEARYGVGVFAFDWRAPILSSSERLAGEVEAALKKGKRVHIVAHSMGSLVARGLAVVKPEVHRMLVEGGGKLILMGPPLRGSHDALAALRGEAELVRLLSVVDISHGSQQISDIVRGFPGLVAMLPREAPPWWEEQSWAGRAPPGLRLAREEAEKLDGVDWSVGTTLILGSAPRTRTGWNEARQTWDWEEGKGDGTVPYRSSRPDGLEDAPCFYVEAAHGNIPRDGEAIRLVQALLAGKTVEGRKEPIHPTRSASSPSSPWAEPLAAWPTEAELLRVALGAGPVLEQPLRQSLRVRILHGSLHEATHPLLMEYAPSAGLQGALSRLAKGEDHLLRRYADVGALPANPGDLFPFQEGPGKPSLLIFGTGEAFSLTSSSLADAVHIALRRYLIDQARSRGPNAEVSVSALLVGTGDTGVLSVAEAVAGLLRGVSQAVDELIHYQLAPVRFGELEIVNAYEDLVALAVDQVQRCLPALATERIRWDYAGHRVGARARGRRLARDDRRSAWNTLSVQMDGGELRYALSARTTKSQAEAVHVPLAILEGELGRVMKSTVHESGSESWVSARLLGRQLIPRDLRAEVLSGAPLRLLLDAAAAALPWELLSDPEEGGGPPFAVRTPLIRSLITQTGRAPSALCARRRVVVFADEAGGDSGLGGLPGAAAEGRAVVEVFRDSGYEDIREVYRQEGGDLRRDLLLTLMEGPCRILHIASHGIFLPEKNYAGILSGQKNGDYQIISADQLLDAFGRELPELVFFNACHVGRLDQGLQPGIGRGRLAASVAEALIQRGVRAVVAAGWAVNDGAARTFAESFYSELLTGQSFGAAVRVARERAWSDFPAVNTWGAYQAYGDPNWCLGSSGRTYYHFPVEAAALDAIEELCFEMEDLAALPAALEAIRRAAEEAGGAIYTERVRQALVDALRKTSAAAIESSRTPVATPSLPAPAAAPARAATTLFAGIGKSQFTLEDGLPTGGYGPGSPKGRAGAHPMMARALALRDDQGGMVVLVVADIHSGTGLLHRVVVEQVRDLGLGAAQVVLAGTHTHTGPGQIYGNRLYDGFAGGFLDPKPLEKAWKPVAKAIQAAIRDAVADLGKPAREVTLAWFQGSSAGIGHNRSAAAFPELLEKLWANPGHPGHGLSELPRKDLLIPGSVVLYCGVRMATSGRSMRW